jgi:hypothetical protein
LDAIAAKNGCLYRFTGSATVCIAACAYTVSEITMAYNDANANNIDGVKKVLVPTSVGGVVDGGKELIDTAVTVPVGTTPMQLKLYSTTTTTGTVTPNGQFSLGSILTWSFPYPSCPLPKVPLLVNEDLDIPYRDTVFPFWSDLETRANGVAYATDSNAPGGGRRFVITWDDARVYQQSTSSLSFSIVFYEGQTYVDVVYGTFTNGNVPTTAAALQPPVTIAVQNLAGTEATACGFFNVGGLAAYNNKAIRFSRVAPVCT